MKALRNIFAVCMIFTALSTAFSAEKKKAEYQYKDQAECRARGGLPNFFKKARDGADIKVAYFGGSITAQGGWRVQSLDLLKKQFPNAKFSEINAAIGGTGSDFGVLRVGPQVIAHKPDLVFVEFAVNDGHGGEHSQKNMEGIVRQILLANPCTDICFVYTLTYVDEKHMLTGKMKRSASMMEDVAELYNIPSIDFGKAVIDLVRDGKMLMKTDSKPLQNVAGEVLNTSSKVLVDKDGKIPFAKDGVHPHHNTGHVVYTGAIERSLPALINASGKAQAHKLPAPMFADAIEKVTVLSLADIKSAAKFKPIDWSNGGVKHFKSMAISPYCKLVPGDEFSFKFKGRQANAMCLLANDGGSIEIQVDNNKPSRRRMFDSFSNGRRQSCMHLCSSSKADDIHTIKLKVLDEDLMPEKKKIIKAASDPKLENRFVGKNVFISTIFLVGDLVQE